MSKQGSFKETAAHAAHAVLHTEAGKNAVRNAGTALAAVAPPALIAAATIAAPVLLIGAIGWGIWSIFNE